VKLKTFNEYQMIKGKLKEDIGTHFTVPKEESR